MLFGATAGVGAAGGVGAAAGGVAIAMALAAVGDAAASGFGAAVAAADMMLSQSMTEPGEIQQNRRNRNGADIAFAPN